MLNQTYLKFGQEHKRRWQPTDLVVVQIELLQVFEFSKVFRQLRHERVGQAQLDKADKIDDVRRNVVNDVSVVFRQKIIHVAKVHSPQILVLAKHFRNGFEPAIFGLEGTEEPRFLTKQVKIQNVVLFERIPRNGEFFEADETSHPIGERCESVVGHVEVGDGQTVGFESAGKRFQFVF